MYHHKGTRGIGSREQGTTRSVSAQPGWVEREHTGTEYNVSLGNS